jgi:C1A family cysteine protease
MKFHIKKRLVVLTLAFAMTFELFVPDTFIIEAKADEIIEDVLKPEAEEELIRLTVWEDDYDGYDEQPLDFNVPAADPALSYQEIREMLVDENRGDDKASITNEDYSVPSSYPCAFSDEAGFAEYVKEYLPPLRSQGAEGACWAHSAISLIENYILRNGKKDLNGTVSITSNGLVPGINYSELQLAYFYYHNNKNPLVSDQNDVIEYTGSNFISNGGNLHYAAQSLINWRGVVDEALMPYSSKSLLTSSDELKAKSGISDRFAYAADTAHLTSAYRINIKENAKQVKQAIKENGAVGISYYSSKSFYDSEHNSYYNYVNSENTNHAVNIVGWDDDFPKEYFTVQTKKPSKNGAWLIRNSWTDTLANPDADVLAFNGYFWISYEDVSLSDAAFVYEADEGSGFDNNYYYTNTFHGVAQANYSKLANVFTVNGEAGVSKERLDAIAFETAEIDSEFDYTVSICKVDGSGKPLEGEGNVYTTETGKVYYPGIYTVKLANPVTFNKGDKFAVILDTSRDDCIGMEYQSDNSGNYKVKVYSNPGEGFRFWSGKWYDYYFDPSSEYYGKDGNICIQAFTTDIGTDGNQKIEGLTVSARTESSITLKWDKLSNATSYCIYRAIGESNAYSDNFTKIKSGETSDTYTDTSVGKNSHAYYYVVPVIGGEKPDRASRIIATEPRPSDDSSILGAISSSTNSVIDGKPAVYGRDGSIGADGYLFYYRKKGVSAWQETDAEMSNYSSDEKMWYFYKELLSAGYYDIKIKPYFINMYGERKYGGETEGSLIIKYPAPSNISSTYDGTEKTLTISWDPVEGAPGYKIYNPKTGNTNTYLTLGTTTDGICTFTTSYVLTTSPSIQEKLVDNTKYKFYIYVYDPGIKKSDGKDEYSWNYAEEAEYEAETNAKPSLMSSDFIFTVNKAVYDGNPHGASVNSAIADVADSDISIYYKKEGSEEVWSVQQPSESGTYAVAIDVESTIGYSSAIKLTDPTWKFTIDKEMLSYSTKPAAKSELIYSGLDYELVTAGAASGGTLQYAIGTGDSVEPETGWSEDVPSGMNAGTYYVWYRVTGDDNHEGLEASCVKVVIAPKSIEGAVIELKNDGLAYTGEEQSIEISGIKLGETVLVAESDYTVAEGLSGTDAGNYILKVTGTGNYTGTAETEWSISEPEITVVFGDVNEDGDINAKDVTQLRRYLAGGWNVTINMANSDVNGDDTVNAKDVTQLRRYLAGGWNVTLGKTN